MLRRVYECFSFKINSHKPFYFKKNIYYELSLEVNRNGNLYFPLSSVKFWVLTISTTWLPADGAVASIDIIEYNPDTDAELCKTVGPSNVLNG